MHGFTWPACAGNGKSPFWFLALVFYEQCFIEYRRVADDGDPSVLKKSQSM
jgi:hypothetical protein